MKLVLYSVIYFGLIILIFAMTRVIARRSIKNDLQLEQTKFLVWFFLNSFIIILTVIFISLILFELLIITEIMLLTIMSLAIIILLFSIIYLLYRLKIIKFMR